MNQSEKLIEKSEKTEMVSMDQKIDTNIDQIARSIPNLPEKESLILADTLSRIMRTRIRRDQKLANCTYESILGAVFTCAELGIMPINGRAYILPFGKVATFVLGYKGIADMFFKHGKSINLEWAVVHEADEFDYELGTSSFLKHKPAKADRGEVIGYWVLAKLANGGAPFMYMTKADCMAHGKQHSKSFNGYSSPWKTSPDSMCLKTVLIQLSKLLPISSEIQAVIASDETTRDYTEGATSLLEMPDKMDWKEEEAKDDK